MLNMRWIGSGEPTKELAKAGVVMWVMDGDGIEDGHSFPSPERPWLPDATSPRGDRKCASLVNHRHPDVCEPRTPHRTSTHELALTSLN
jgi:hypothetical protein